MKRIFALICLILSCCAVSKAQLETAVWYFGRNAGLDFNTPEPKILLDGALDNLEGVATFSDSLGNLLFYTDGRTAWNREHRVMLNGDQLVGHVSSTESAIIMPWPGNPYKYFLFVVDAEFGDKGLSYSVVDMRLDGGLGGISAEKNIQLEDVVCEKVTAIRHANNRDFWLLTRPVPGSVILEYLVDESGIVLSSRREFDVCDFPIEKENGMYNPATGQYENTYDPTMAIGYMRIAPNGRKIAVANASTSLTLEDGTFINILDVLDFDPETGLIAPYLTYYDPEAFLYGVEFSNDVSKLYFTSRRKIFQMDFALPSKAQVLNSVTQIGEYPMLTDIDTSYAGALQLALNGKIYVAQRDNEYLGVIEHPREAGKACNYIVEGQYLGGRKSLMGLPNFVPTYFLPPKFTIVNNCANDVTRFSCIDGREIESYEWKLSNVEGDLIAKADTRDFEYQIPEPGKYRISMTISSMGVEHSDYRIFEVYNPPLISLQNDTIICNGSVLRLQNYEAEYCTFEWLNHDGGNFDVSTSLTAVGMVTDMLTGCTNTDDVKVEVADPYTFTLGDDLSYCAGLSTGIDVDIDMANYREWLWADNFDPSTHRIFNVPGTYIAKGVDINYCEVSDTVIIIENQLPKIDFGADEVLCENIARSLDCGVPDARYSWSSGEKTQAIKPKTAGKYVVTVTDVNGCVSKDSIELIWKILPDVSLPADTVLCDGETLTLDVFWDDAMFYQWQDQSSDYQYIVSQPGTFKVKVENVCGSVDDEVRIRYRYCGEFIFPNIITPNGDDINDYFRIKGLDGFTSGWQMDIFNRLGNNVYHSDDYHNEWNAPDVSDGVYFWMMQRGEERYTGNVTVFHR